MRTGDHVRHNPTGEKWIVAWADPESGYMAPCGWPTCEARILDCVVIKKATDEQHFAMVDKVAASGRSDAHKAKLFASEAK